MNIPFAVGGLLYHGISDTINFLIKNHSTLSHKTVENYYNELKEGLDWYKDNCMVSYNCLKKEFDYLTELLTEEQII